MNLAMMVVNPAGAEEHEFVTILHFSSYEKLEEWENAPARHELKKRLKGIGHEQASFREVTGFEYWFSLPKAAALKPPRRYKMALITTLGLFMLSLIYTYTVNEWLMRHPPSRPGHPATAQLNFVFFNKASDSARRNQFRP